MKLAKFEATGKEVAGILAGIVAGNTIVKHVPSKFVPVATIVGGAVLASTMKNPIVKTMAVGLTAFGAVATLNQLSQPKAGEIQTGYKAMISKVVPQLSGIPGLGNLSEIDMSEYDFEPMEGVHSADLEAENLLGMGEYDEEYYDELEGLNGEEQMAEKLLGLAA